MQTDSHRGIALSGFNTTPPSIIRLGGVVRLSGPFRQTFEVGKIYHRQRDIHQAFGGQKRGGLSTPGGCPFVFLFTGESGEQFGYSDGWRPDGIFAYTGEGQNGDMTFVRGN
jgi:hypothetical protein